MSKKLFLVTVCCLFFLALPVRAVFADPSTITLPDGSAAAPALNFINNLEAGLYRLDNNLIGLTTNGSSTSGIIIDSQGNVGIGTTNPSARLHMNGGVFNMENGVLIMNRTSASQYGGIMLNDYYTGDMAEADIVDVNVGHKNYGDGFYVNNNGAGSSFASIINGPCEITGCITGNSGANGAGVKLQLGPTGGALIVALNGNGMGMPGATHGNPKIEFKNYAPDTGYFFSVGNSNPNATSRTLNIDNAGKGQGIFLNQTGDSIGFQLYQTGAGSAVSITKRNSAVGQALAIGNFVNNTAIHLTQAGNAVGLFINKSGTGGGNALQIDNAGTGAALQINNKGKGAAAIFLGGNVGIGAASTKLGPLQIGSANNAYISSGGAWTNGSSKGFKENFVSLNKEEILKKINLLNIKQWNYKNEKADIKHIGPTAEDFYAAFELGKDTEHISTVDPAGVALVGIQALSQKINRFSKTIGKAVLPAGKLSVNISNNQVTNTSVIFITPTSFTNNQMLILSNQKSGEGFTISLEKPVNKDIKFNWIIIENVEN